MKHLLEKLAEESPETILADGFEDALVGSATRGGSLLAVYNYNKCVEILMKRNGMPWSAAVEFMEFNVSGAWVGQYTPVFVIPAEEG
jgi:hypothetical protein